MDPQLHGFSLRVDPVVLVVPAPVDHWAAVSLQVLQHGHHVLLRGDSVGSPGELVVRQEPLSVDLQGNIRDHCCALHGKCSVIVTDHL